MTLPASDSSVIEEAMCGSMADQLTRTMKGPQSQSMYEVNSHRQADLVQESVLISPNGSK
jgi:hypothetical protein